MNIDDLSPHVIIVRGGTNDRHRQRSLSSGSSVYHTLRDRLEVVDVHLSTTGSFEMQGKEMALSDLLSIGGVIFNTLQAQEAGQLQQACRDHDIPHTGNAHTAYGQASAIAKKDILRKTSIPTIPYWRLENDYDSAEDALYGAILEKMRYPTVISPLPDTFSVDALVVTNETELMEVLRACFALSAPVTVSDTYEGDLYSVIVMESFRGESPYAFPPHELLHNHEVANAYDPDTADYQRVEDTEKLKDVENLAKNACKELRLRDITQVSILKTPEDELYVLDIDPHPRLDRHSLLSDAVGDVGATMEEVLTSVVNQAKIRQSGQLKKVAHAL